MTKEKYIEHYKRLVSIYKNINETIIAGHISECELVLMSVFGVPHSEVISIYDSVE